MNPVSKRLKEKKIKNVVNTRLVQAAPDISVKTAVELMQEKGSGYVIIADPAHTIMGIFTETDLARRVLGCPSEIWDHSVTEFMTEDPIVLSPEDTVEDAINVMGSNNFYHIPLVDDNKKLTGVLSVRTLIRFLSEFYPSEIYNLPPTPGQVMQTPEGG